MEFMFILSFKTSRIKLISAGVVLLAFFVIIIYAVSSAATAETGIKPANPVELSDNEKRLEFLHSFGYQVQKEPVEVAEVIIPTEFDDIYLEYNSLQKKQGYDLTAYRGERVKRYTYEVKNYPEHPAHVRAEILVHEGKVIGGNVSSILENGFMHGFEIENRK